MRTDSARFSHDSAQRWKEPRHVVNIEFPTASIYVTSHGDISGVPGVVLNGALQRPVVVSQRIIPDEGRSEIGSASFRLVDLGSAFTTDIRSKLAAGNGLRRRTVRFYRGYRGYAFADMQLINTQIVRNASYEAGVYFVNCQDITREQRKDLFALSETTLTANVSATDTTINVNDATAFTGIVHDASYTDAPGAAVGYVKIKDEIIRYPVASKTSTAFVGCTRAVFGTRAAAYTVDAGVAQDRREKVTEYVYLEGPVPKIIYALQTGVLHGDAANLPAHWHCGMDTGFIRLTDYTAIGPDLWVPGSPTAGLRCRFEGLAKTDGKAFIERELLTLIGCFQPVYADGTLGLKRATRIFRDAATVLTLNESNSIQVGALEHDMESLHNDFVVHWNHNGERFTRTNLLRDQTSINAHGRAPLREVSFKGLHGSIHTDGFIAKLIDAQRDRYAGPPERMRVRLLHAMNRLEVGDVTRANYAVVRDYAGPAGPMDRSMEIQQFTDDGETFEAELFGSTAAPSIDSPTTPATALPDAWYISQGTNLTTVLTIVGDVVQPGVYNLTGNADLNNAGAIYYYAGNLTVANGATINLGANVQLRIRGFCQNNGTINGNGGGLAGVADSGGSLLDTPAASNTIDPTVFSTIAGNPGYVGNSRGMDGYQSKFGLLNRNNAEHTVPCASVIGRNPAAPILALSVVGGVLVGLPSDLRGSGGAPGGRAVAISNFGSITNAALGGTGAAGGAGLAIICRGMASGASGVINLDGNDSAATSQVTANGVDGFAGAGGAGGPGTLYVLMDGAGLSVPSIGTANFLARTGTVPINGNPLPKRTYNDAKPPIQDALMPVAGFLDEGLISAVDLFNACQRIQYVPASETANPDVESAPPAPLNMLLSPSPGFISGTVMLPPNLPAGILTRVYASITNNRPDAVLVAEGRVDVFALASPALQTRWFWATNYDPETGLESDFLPNTLTSTFSSASLGGGSFTLVPRGQCQVVGNTIRKVGGVAAWDSDTHSQEGYVGGAFASARASQTNMDVAFGLNGDPLTDQSWTSLDYQWQFNGDGLVRIYESGVLVLTFGSYTTSTVLTVFYDGSRVIYLKDGVVARIVDATARLLLHFDSSFFSVNSQLNSVSFGPVGPRGSDGPPGNANNLIANGYCLAIDAATGRLSNWTGKAEPGATLIPTAEFGQGFVGPYSMRVAAGVGGTVESDEYIPVDLRRYSYELRVRQKGTGSPESYIGLRCYDERLRNIAPHNAMGLFNRAGTLNANASISATSVDIDAISGFTAATILKNGGTNDFVQLNTQTNATDLPNFQAYSVASVTDLGGSVWRLNFAAGSLLEAHTAGEGIRFSESGGSYAYAADSPLTLTTSYVQRSQVFNGFDDLTKLNAIGALRVGTKFVRPIWLPNYPGNDGPSDSDEWELTEAPLETSEFISDPFFRSGVGKNTSGAGGTDQYHGYWTWAAAFWGQTASAGPHTYSPNGGWPGGIFQFDINAGGITAPSIQPNRHALIGHYKPTPLQNGTRIRGLVRIMVTQAVPAGTQLRITHSGLNTSATLMNLNTDASNGNRSVIDISLLTVNQLYEIEVFCDVNNLTAGQTVYYSPQLLLTNFSAGAGGVVRLLGYSAAPGLVPGSATQVFEGSTAPGSNIYVQTTAGGGTANGAITGVTFRPNVNGDLTVRAAYEGYVVETGAGDATVRRGRVYIWQTSNPAGTILLGPTIDVPVATLANRKAMAVQGKFSVVAGIEYSAGLYHELTSTANAAENHAYNPSVHVELIKL